jgi:hypothetical protein
MMSVRSQKKAGMAVLAALALGLAGCGSPERSASEAPLAAVKADVAEPVIKGGTPDMRRLTDAQYRNIVGDIFGHQITVVGNASLFGRTAGLLAVGARTSRITPSEFEQYYTRARLVAQAVVAPQNRDSIIPCTPASATAADNACAQQFFSAVGPLLFRRPLHDQELQTAVVVAADGAQKTGSFYNGIAASLTGMLTSPQFLFVVDETESDPGKAGAERLTAYAKASRLSFLLWNTTPDAALLAAAKKGDLHTKKGVAQQVDRLMTSVRLENGTRAFFEDFLHFEMFETLEKDNVIYPAFTVEVIDDAKEQVLRTLVAHLIARNGDYRDIFTTRQTFLTGALARIYRVPVTRPAGRAWIPYEFPADDQRVGVISQIGFVAAASHPGRSSPTLRGKAIREHLLCQRVPDPPGTVDFSGFEDPESILRTARERLDAHASNPVCKGCHKITDPIGLALENFDGAGQLRSMENGVPIDLSGEFEGKSYTDSRGLAEALRTSPAVVSCLVGRLASYATGRATTSHDNPYLKFLETGFAANGYRFPDLMRRVAISDAFFTISAPQAPGTEAALQKTPQVESTQ